MSKTELARQLIRATRGRMSQQRLSERLGYSSNVLYLWERGARLPSIGAFFALAASRHKPVRASLSEFVGDTPALDRILPADPTLPIDIGELIRWLCGELSAIETATLTGIDRSTISRWLRGKTQPRLPEFLKLLEATTQRLLEFVDLFVEAPSLAATREAFAELQRQKRLAFEMPWSHAVLHALNLDAYRQLKRGHAAWLGRQLGLTAELVDTHLSALEEAKLIEKREGRWCQLQVTSVDTRTDFEANRNLKRHWAQVASERVKALRSDHRSLFSYNLFPISSGDLEQLRQLHLDYYARVRTLVASAEGAEHVVLMNLQLCVLDEQS